MTFTIRRMLRRIGRAGFVLGLWCGLFFLTFVSAQTTSIDGFEVEFSKNPAEVNEQIDVTVRALLDDGSVASSYEGQILFYFDSEEAVDDSIFTVPSSGFYTFLPEDLGEKTFSKSLSVSRAGTYEFVVTDLDDPSIESTQTLVIGGQPEEVEELQEVVINSPLSGERISSSVINVIGQSDVVRAPVQILINDTLMQTEGETNADGEFTVFVSDEEIGSGQAELQVRLLNFDGQVVGRSESVPFIYAPPATDDLFRGLSVEPDTTIQDGETFTFTVEANETINSVQLRIGDVIRPLTKDTPSTFSNEVLLQPGSYDVDVTLILDDGQRRVYEDQTRVTVEDVLSVQNVRLVKDANQDGRVQISWDVEGGQAEQFAVTYGTQRNLLSERQEVESTALMVEGLNAEEYFFQVTPLDASGAVIGQPSSIVSLSFAAHDSGGESPANTGVCSVQGIRVSTTKIGDSYYLTWPSISGATRYIVYRSDFPNMSLDAMQRVAETSDTKFMYPFDAQSEQDEYAYYAVQAICDSGQSPQIGGTVQVQVGPETDLLFLFLLSVLCYGLYHLYQKSLII